MTTFGASGPYKTLAEHFGFTPDQVAEKVRTQLGKG
jgi:transketolase